jgi:hypothetical protein
LKKDYTLRPAVVIRVPGAVLVVRLTSFLYKYITLMYNKKYGPVLEETL